MYKILWLTTMSLPHWPRTLGKQRSLHTAIPPSCRDLCFTPTGCVYTRGRPAVEDGLPVHFCRYKEQASITGGRALQLTIGIAGRTLKNSRFGGWAPAHIKHRHRASTWAEVLQVWNLDQLYCSPQEMTSLNISGRRAARRLWSCIWGQ